MRVSKSDGSCSNDACQMLYLLHLFSEHSKIYLRFHMNMMEMSARAISFVLVKPVDPCAVARQYRADTQPPLGISLDRARTRNGLHARIVASPRYRRSGDHRSTERWSNDCARRSSAPLAQSHRSSSLVRSHPGQFAPVHLRRAFRIEAAADRNWIDSQSPVLPL